MAQKSFRPGAGTSSGVQGGLLSLPNYSTDQWVAGQGSGPASISWGNGLNPADLAALGWDTTPGEGKGQYGGAFEALQGMNDGSGGGADFIPPNLGQTGYSPAFQQFLQSKGLTSRVGVGNSGYAQQFYNQNGTPFGQGYKSGTSDDDAFGIGTLAAGGLAGYAAAGAAGAGGLGGAETLEGGAYPASITGGQGGVSGLSAAGANGMQLTPAQLEQYKAMFEAANATGGAGLNSSMGAQAIEGAAGAGAGGGVETAAAGAGVGGGAAAGGTGGSSGGLMNAIKGLLPEGTNLGQIAQLASAAGSLYSASKASDANSAGIAAQQGAAAGQLGLAQDQWNYFKNIYLPKQMDLADQQQQLASKVANQQLADSAYYRGVSEQAVAQAQKSYAFQDKYMDLANKYASGQMANTLADEAQSDVQQAGALQRGITERDMERRGVNPNSGAGMALQHDDQIAQAAAGAGAQTAARRMARDKAESMIATAAGAGQAGFGTGLQAGGLAMGNNNAAVSNQQTASNTLNAGAQTYGYGTAQAGNSYYGAGRTGVGLSSSYAGSPFADAISGIFKGGVGSGLFNSGTSPYTTAGNSYGLMGGQVGSGNYDYANNGQGIFGQAGDYSDLRLKTDLKLVGRTSKGYRWYTFKWKTGGEGEGVIAQEVLIVDPSAVSYDEQGFLKVDYSKVT